MRDRIRRGRCHRLLLLHARCQSSRLGRLALAPPAEQVLSPPAAAAAAAATRGLLALGHVGRLLAERRFGHVGLHHRLDAVAGQGLVEDEGGEDDGRGRLPVHVLVVDFYHEVRVRSDCVYLGEEFVK